MGGYGRGLGNADNGLYKRAGYGNKFRTHFSANNLCRDLVQSMWGQTPNPADPNDGRCLWFPAAQKSGKYRISDGVVFLPGTIPGGLGGRMCWNTATQTYVDATGGGGSPPPGQYNYDPAAGTRWIYIQEPTGSTLQIARMGDSIVKGSAFVRDRLTIIVAIGLRNEANNALKCVLLYPMGISHVTLKIDQQVGDSSEIMVVNEYDGTSQTPFLYPVLGTSAEHPAPNMFRLPISSIAVLLGNKKNFAKTSLDDPGIPSRLTFYVRNPVTGLRGALADRQIVKIIRKNNVPLAWAESPVLG